jgi:hypothetical protein
MKEKEKTMDLVWAAVEEAREETASLVRELEDLKQKKAEIEARFSASIESGAIEELKTLRVERETLEDLILIAENKLKKPAKKVDVLSAFRDFAEKHNKAFREELADYIKARDALFLQYMKLQKMQNAALYNQYECDKYLADDSSSVWPGFLHHEDLRILELFPTVDNKLFYMGGYRTPEVAFFGSLGYMNQTETCCASAVIDWHSFSNLSSEK